MKKILTVVLVALMAFSMFSCGGSGAEKATPANAFLGQFTVAADDSKSCADIVSEMIQGCLEAGELPDDLALVNGPAEEGFLNGFTEEIKGFTEGEMFAPGIGAIPMVGYVFTVEDDADGFAQNLKDKADPRWNVCTEADETICEVSGNKVFFIMAPASFEEE